MAQHDALIGLCSWVALAQSGHSHWIVTEEGEARLILTAQLANSFQVGMLRTDNKPPQPVLAYSPELWWFPEVWEHIAITVQGLILTANTNDPLQILVPTDSPKSMTALHQAVRHCGTDWLCAPYSQSYLDRWAPSEGSQRRPIAQLEDLQLDASCEIVNLDLEEEWITTLLPRFR